MRDFSWATESLFLLKIYHAVSQDVKKAFIKSRRRTEQIERTNKQISILSHNLELAAADKVTLDRRPYLFALDKVKVVLEVNHLSGTTSDLSHASII